MKKRVLAIFACTVFALSLATGCGSKTDAAPETPDTDNPVVEAESLEPLTEDDILAMYTDAADIYADINMVDFEVDTEATILKNENTYYKITDERFESYDDFQKYLMQYFTKAFMQDNLLDDELFTEGKDGYLYVLGAGRGTNIFYAGYALDEPVIAEDLITLDVTAYYTVDEPYTGDLLDNKFVDSEEFETETFQFTLIPEDGAWKFDTFTMFY